MTTIREERPYRIVEEPLQQPVVVATTGQAIQTLNDLLGEDITQFIALTQPLEGIKNEEVLQQERLALAPLAHQLIEAECRSTNWALLRYGAVLHVVEFHRLYLAFDYDTWPEFLAARKLDPKVVAFAMDWFNQADWIQHTVGMNVLAAVPVVTETTLRALKHTRRQAERTARMNTTSTPGFSAMSAATEEATYQAHLQEVVQQSQASIFQALETPDNYLEEHMRSQTPGAKLEKETLVLTGKFTPEGDFAFDKGVIPRDLLQGGLGTGHYTVELKIDGVYHKLADIKRELDKADLATYDPGID